MPASSAVKKKSIRLRARSFVAYALTPEAPLDEWLERLDGWTANSPGYFLGRPVLLDLSSLALGTGEIEGLVAALGFRGIRVYAIEAKGMNDLGPALPPLLVGAKPAPEEDAPAPEIIEAAPARPETPPPSGSMIIRAPVRSGQSIWQPNGDVIVLGSVGSGSEIVATGSVHVYGTLRGRVIAGASGDGEARIFCQRNEAELLAVDGWYRTAESMEPASRGRAIQAYLEDGVVQVAALN